jgi:Ca-activated chloride channel family protein
MNSDDPRLPCATFAEELSHFVLGELPDDRRGALEQHLASCPACRAERDLLQRSVALLAREGGPDAPILALSDARRAQLLGQAAARPPGLVRSWWTLPRLAAAAAVLAVVGLGGHLALRDRAASCEEATLADRRPGFAAPNGRDSSNRNDALGKASESSSWIPARPDAFECTVKPGDWTVWVMAPGYYKYVTTLALEAGKEKVHEVYLERWSPGLATGTLDSSRPSTTPAGPPEIGTPLAPAATPATPALAALKLVIRDEHGNEVHDARAWLFRGDSPVQSAPALAATGRGRMVGIKIPMEDAMRGSVAGADEAGGVAAGFCPGLVVYDLPDVPPRGMDDSPPSAPTSGLSRAAAPEAEELANSLAKASMTAESQPRVMVIEEVAQAPSGMKAGSDPDAFIDAGVGGADALRIRPRRPNHAIESHDEQESAKRSDALAALSPELRTLMQKQKKGEEMTAEETKLLRQGRRIAREAKQAGLAFSGPGTGAKSSTGIRVRASGEESSSEVRRELEALGYGSGGGGAATPNEEVVEALRRLGYLEDADGATTAAPWSDSIAQGAVLVPNSGTALRAHPGQPLATLPALDAQGFFADGGASDIRGSSENFFVGPPQFLGWRLADALAPNEVFALQPQVAAAFKFDPGTPADGGDRRRAEEVVREFMNRLAPRQGETPRDMFFRYFGDHPFVSTRIDCMSTFGMDVDTASYNLVRAYLTQGNLPPKAAVRTEEFVNAFRHDLAPPPPSEDRDHGAEVFAIHTELAPSPFGEPGQLLLQVGLKARETPRSQRRPVALTFVIDVSGSMEEGGRLELVKRALRLLVDQLDERDSIGIVVFSTNGRRVLDPTNAARRGSILSTLDPLRPDGSTNADAGLRLGYDMALEQLKPEAENRVILCSDGVANTGVTDVNWLVARIRECRSRYVYLNCIGVGMNNHNDALLEQLADEGDGFCAYVDRDEEAKEIFVDRLTGTLTTVARNAKVQVEFDPAAVRRFRQLGYENRALAHRDFRNDRVDAGEVGAGHEVIALYELDPQPGAIGPLATVRCRYEEPRSSEVIEQARAVFVAETAQRVELASARFRLAAAVAEFAELLRQSIHARYGSLADVQRLAEPLVDELRGDSDVAEFVALVKQAARLPDLVARRSDLVRCVDEIKRLRCVEAELRRSDAAQDPANADLLRQLEEQNRRLEQALRDALERAARGS